MTTQLKLQSCQVYQIQTFYELWSVYLSRGVSQNIVSKQYSSAICISLMKIRSPAEISVKWLTRI